MSASQATKLKSGKSGRDQYSDHYRKKLERQVGWLKIGAQAKADSVEILLRKNGIRPNSLLELGCGTGAVLLELQKRELASMYFGVDFSEEAIDHLSSVSRNIELSVEDIVDNPNPFGEDRYDLVVLTHTIEHLEEPEVFLEKMHEIPFEHVIVEVPLEDLVFGRLKSRFKDRSKNAAGHVQFFNGKSFVSLLENCGYDIVDRQRYAPVLSPSSVRELYSQQGLLKVAFKMMSESIGPASMGPVWSRVYHGHYALLCRRR